MIDRIALIFETQKENPCGAAHRKNAVGLFDSSTHLLNLICLLNASDNGSNVLFGQICRGKKKTDQMAHEFLGIE